MAAAILYAGIAVAADDAGPIVYRYVDPDTGQMASYVGIPGGPVVYSEVGPGGIKSLTSAGPGSPATYSDLGPGNITSVSHAGPGGPVVYSRLGSGGIISVSLINKEEPVVVYATDPSVRAPAGVS